MKRQVMSYYVPIKKKISNFCTFLFLDFHYSEKERKKPSIGLSSQLCWTSLANEWISLSPPRMQQVGGLSSVIFTCILVVCRGNYVCPVGERTRKDEIATFYQKKKNISIEFSWVIRPGVAETVGWSLVRGILFQMTNSRLARQLLYRISSRLNHSWLHTARTERK